MSNYATVWYGVVATGAGPITAGLAVVPVGDGTYAVATAANRALYGRSVGIARTTADAGKSFQFQVAGPHTISSTGAADDYVRVDANGALERTASPGGSDDLIGRCPHTTAVMMVQPVLSQAAGGGTPGGASGDIQINNAGAFGGLTPGAGISTFLATPSGANLAAALTTPLPNTKGGTGQDSSGWTGLALVTAGVWSALTIAAGAATFLGTPSSANLRSLVTDETGTGALVFADTPTLVTPNIGAATGTSLNLSGGLTLGTDLTVPNGGTGASSFTANSFLLGNGAGALTDTGAAFAFSGSVITANVVMQWGNPAGAFPTHGFNKLAEDSGDWLVARQTGGGGNDLTALSFATDEMHIGATSAGSEVWPATYLHGTEINIYAANGGSGVGRLKFTATSLDVQSGIRFIDGGGDHYLSLVVPDLAANRTLNVPTLTATDTMAVLGLAQTFSALQTFTANVAAGSGTKAGVGTFRAASHATAGVYVRNSIDTLDIPLAASDASENITIGHPTGSGSLIMAVAGNIINRSPGFYVQSAGGSADRLIINSVGVRSALPYAGMSDASKAFALGVTSITQSSTADTVLSAAQYENPQLEITGTPGGNFNVIGPAQAGAVFCVVNRTANVCTFKKSGGVTTLTIAAGNTTWVRYDTSAGEYARTTANVAH